VAPLTIYYVAIDDNGLSGPLIGCGDSLVATTTAPVRFTDQVRPSIETLLANKSRDVGLSGLVNVLYQSNLTYTGGELAGSTITIYLTGQFMLGGVCDIPRAKAQLEYTAMAAAGATGARVFVNGRPIDEVLSLKKCQQWAQGGGRGELGSGDCRPGTACGHVPGIRPDRAVDRRQTPDTMVVALRGGRLFHCGNPGQRSLVRVGHREGAAAEH
jgi:hypothetical protein